MTILAWVSLLYLLVGIVWALWPHDTEPNFAEFLILVLIWPVFMFFLFVYWYRIHRRL
jgi:hypothetical protein